jgi:hypothetical protein
MACSRPRFDDDGSKVGQFGLCPLFKRVGVITVHSLACKNWCECSWWVVWSLRRVAHSAQVPSSFEFVEHMNFLHILMHMQAHCEQLCSKWRAGQACTSTTNAQLQCPLPTACPLVNATPLSPAGSPSSRATSNSRCQAVLMTTNLCAIALTSPHTPHDLTDSFAHANSQRHTCAAPPPIDFAVADPSTGATPAHQYLRQQPTYPIYTD